MARHAKTSPFSPQNFWFEQKAYTALSEILYYKSPCKIYFLQRCPLVIDFILAMFPTKDWQVTLCDIETVSGIIPKFWLVMAMHSVHITKTTKSKQRQNDELRYSLYVGINGLVIYKIKL